MDTFYNSIKGKCVCDVLEEIDSFRSLNEYERFGHYLDTLLRDNDLISIGEGQSAYFNLEIYECGICKKRWALAIPDFPFKGFWKIYDTI